MKRLRHGLGAMTAVLAVLLCTGWSAAQPIIRPYVPPAPPITPLPPLSLPPLSLPPSSLRPLPSLPPAQLAPHSLTPPAQLAPQALTPPAPLAQPHTSPTQFVPRPAPAPAPLPPIGGYGGSSVTSNPGFSSNPGLSNSSSNPNLGGGGSLSGSSNGAQSGQSSPTPPTANAEAKRRAKEQERVRGTFRSTLANSPIDALRMLQRDGSVLDGDERARLAKEAIQGLRSRVETLDPWQAVSMVREAQQTSCSEAAAGLAELLRAAESRCLSTATTEIARELKRRQWDKARKLVADRLQQFDSMTSKREQLVRAADCAQEADRLDRLLFALQHFGPDGVRAWQRVPISRLPAEMQGLAKALRGLAVIRGEIAAPWTKPPDLAELRHSFKELRDGGWDAEAIDSLQFDVSARAFDHGHGTAGYGLLQHVVDHITPEQADIQLRDMKRHALEPQEPASGGATTRGPPSVAAFIPHGRAADVRPGVPGRSYATPLEGGMSAKWQRLIRLLLTARQGVQERIDRLTDPALMKALAQLFTRTSTASPPTANGPNTTSTAASAAGAGGGDPPHVLPLLVLPVPLEDDDREKREVLSQMIARLGRPLASPEQFLVSRLYREGETEEAIRAVLSAK